LKKKLLSYAAEVFLLHLLKGKSILFKVLTFFNLKLIAMKKMVSLCLLVYIGISCNNPDAKETATADSLGAAKTNYAYSIKKPDNWEIGSSQNTALALSSLKAFEENKIDESLSYFADSVVFKADYIDGKFSKDSLKGIMIFGRNKMTAFKVDMHDFESVISKDKKDEYVTLWYVQTFTDKKGKTDSTAVINDLKISNGKIVELTEATRHFPVKK
jgi:hypothetical protein